MYCFIDTNKEKNEISKYAKERLKQSELLNIEKETGLLRSRSLRPISSPRKSLKADMVKLKTQLEQEKLNLSKFHETSKFLAPYESVEDRDSDKSLDEGFDDDLPRLNSSNLKPDLCEISEMEEEKHSRRYLEELIEEEHPEKVEMESPEKINEEAEEFHDESFQEPKRKIHHNRDIGSGQFLLKSSPEEKILKGKFQTGLSNYKFPGRNSKIRYSTQNTAHQSCTCGQQKAQGSGCTCFQENKTLVSKNTKVSKKEDSNDGKVVMHSHRSSMMGDEEDPLFDGGEEEDKAEDKEKSEEKAKEEDQSNKDLSSHNSFSSSSFDENKPRDEEFKINVQEFSNSGRNLPKRIDSKPVKEVAQPKKVQSKESELHEKLFLKANFYSTQRQLFKDKEKDEFFREIMTYTKLMDLPRRNEIFEEFMKDEDKNPYLEKDEQEAINFILKKYRKENEEEFQKQGKCSCSCEEIYRLNLKIDMRDTITTTIKKVEDLQNKFKEMRAQNDSNKSKYQQLSNKIKSMKPGNN